jgi:ArsR family transcriptional regulator
MSAIGSLPDGLDVAVDLGSGPGRTVPVLATRARTVVAVDSSPGMLSLRRHDHPALIADGRELPIRSGTVDVCCLRMSMHYFPIPVLRDELARVLKPRGWVVIISIFPYGRDDESWFNERHRLKGKTSAFTPWIGGLARTLESSFESWSSESWTVVQSIRSSLRSHPVGAGGKLIEHALSAPASIRERYRTATDDHGDVSITVQWAALIFRTR